MNPKFEENRSGRHTNDRSVNPRTRTLFFAHSKCPGPPSEFLWGRGTKIIFAAAVGLLMAGLGFVQAADTFTPGQLRHEFFPGAVRADVENGVVTTPGSVQYVNAFEFADEGLDNYTRRVSGFFIPPTTGNYVFYITSDDDSDLFLSTDESPANKRLIAQETAWSSALQWNESAGGSNVSQKRSDRFVPAGATNAPFAGGIALTAGQRYYIEGVQHEGTGGDNFAVTFTTAGQEPPAVSTPSALTGDVIGILVPSEARFLSQPLNRRVLAGQTVSFSAPVEPPNATIQWFRNGTAIAGATSNVFETTITAADNAATYHAVATLNGVTTQSSNAVVTVGAAVQLPFARREFWGDDALTRAEVVDPAFATPPDSTNALPTFETPTNESDNYVQRVSALFVPPVTGNYVFFIAADDDADLFLSTDSTPANKRQIASETGWSTVRNWTGASGNGAGLSTEQSIAQKRSDRWIPDPANDPGAAAPFTNGISLTAGQSYYLEAVHHEGGGGDNLAVTYKVVGEPDPVNGDAPRITAFTMAPYASGLSGAFINVTNAPVNTSVEQNRTATLSIGAASGYTGDASNNRPPIAFQWQTAPSGSTTFTNIPNATGTSFTTPQLGLGESGRQYRVALISGDVLTNSPAATVTVNPDTNAPRPNVVASVSAGFNRLILSFNEPLERASAELGSNYSFAPGNIAGTTATLDATGTNVTINTAGPLTPNVTNTLTITGVRDVAGNAVAANTTLTFSFQPITYAANILLDQPLGYYRFEETTGSVATNSGTLGGNGVYYTGDEAAPGEGGTPSQAKGDPGPRPPAFAGFDTENRAATFDGVGEWVDTKNQFLQGRSAFTLEYWVKPIRTNTVDGSVWPGRVGIVGQNDAVEYGFITPGTIQIWTPGGGMLDAAYPFADNEWHHVATIADGRSLRTYFDGVLAGTGGTTTANYGTSTYFVHIGGGGVFDVTGNWFNGQIDEVAIFDKAIPAERVLAHFRAGREGGVLVTNGNSPNPGDTNRVTLSITGTGQSRTISWTPEGGMLQSTTALTGATTTWTDVTANNPATITLDTGTRFYRVRR